MLNTLKIIVGLSKVWLCTFNSTKTLMALINDLIYSTEDAHVSSMFSLIVVN